MVIACAATGQLHLADSASDVPAQYCDGNRSRTTELVVAIVKINVASIDS